MLESTEQETKKSALGKAVVRMLRPLAKILLKYDVSYGEFAELAKRAYVDAARKFFSLPNRRQSFARVAVITGLSRKEVDRLSRSDDEAPPLTTAPLNRARRVIGGWLKDPDFTENGKPRPLALREGDHSFQELVTRYSGDISARAILDELIRVGSVRKVDKHTVAVTTGGYVPEKSDTEKIDIMARHMVDLLSTVSHNIESKPTEARFQRQVTYTDIPESVIDEFRAFSHEKCLELLLELNRWLAEKKSNVPPDSTESKGRLGVGIYFFRNDTQGE